MKTKYMIAENIIRFHLRKEYNVQAKRLEFIPMGDSAYSYKVYCENGDCYYLKLFDHSNDRQRKGVEQLHSYLSVIWQLYHRALFPAISYPIRKQTGEFATSFNHITIVLFNYIEGERLANAYPFSSDILKVSEQKWLKYTA